MPSETVVLCARAHVLSLGGWFFIGAIVLLGLLAATAGVSVSSFSGFFWLIILLFFVAIAYVADGLSERLEVRGDDMSFDTWLRPRRTLSLRNVKRIQFVHEGLNAEQGIETIRVHDADGTEKRFALGPFWRRHEVEAFLRDARRVSGARFLLEDLS